MGIEVVRGRESAPYIVGKSETPITTRVVVVVVWGRQYTDSRVVGNTPQIDQLIPPFEIIEGNVNIL